MQREMADYQQRVADRIVQVREAAGYDREPFALRAGISVKQLRRIEQGKSNPRLGTVRKIAETAGVKITDIRPDLDEEEQEVRAQLDRIEAMLQKLLAANGLASETGEIPTDLPDGPEPPPEEPDEPESETG